MQTEHESPIMETEYILIKQSGIHAFGAFARKFIPKGTRFTEYVGEKISKEEAERRLQADAVYIFEVDETHDIDGDVPYHPAKYLNHSCDPNCESAIEDGHIWIFSLQDIKEGEELTYDYGYDPKDLEETPCRCGAKNCVGYMIAEEHRSKISEYLKENKK